MRVIHFSAIVAKNPIEKNVKNMQNYLRLVPPPPNKKEL